MVLGFTRIETRVVSCIRAFFLVAWILWFMFRSHLHVNFPAFSHIISACLIMQTNFIFQQIKLHVQKRENQAPQNYQSMFTEVTSFEEVKLSYTRASKFQPLAWRANVLLAAKRGIAWKAAARKRLLRSGNWEQKWRKPDTSLVPGTILDGKAERKVGRKRKRGQLTPSKMLERLSWKSICKTAVQDGLSFGRVCRRT